MEYSVRLLEMYRISTNSSPWRWQMLVREFETGFLKYFMHLCLHNQPIHPSIHNRQLDLGSNIHQVNRFGRISLCE
jgi:hypothetical protein